MSASLLVIACGATRDHDAPPPPEAAAAREYLSRAAAARRFLGGVATTTARRRRFVSAPSVVRFRQVEYRAVVYNMGTERPFALFGTTTRTVRFTRTSGATVVDSESPLRFASAGAVAAWRASGAPRLPLHESHHRRYDVPAGEYSFAARGESFTYADIRRLDGSPATARAVRARLGPSSGAANARQYAFLVSSAPLRPAARAALVRAMAAVPGMHLCGERDDVADRHGRRAVCVGDGLRDYKFVFDARARLRAIEERLVAPSPTLPTVPPGAVVQRDAFFT